MVKKTMGKCSICYSNNVTKSTCPLVKADAGNCAAHYNAELIQLVGKSNMNCIAETYHQNIPHNTSDNTRMKCYDFSEISTVSRISTSISRAKQDLKIAKFHEPGKVPFIEEYLARMEQVLLNTKAQMYKKMTENHITFTAQYHQFLKSNIVCGSGAFKKVYLAYDLDCNKTVVWIQLRSLKHTQTYDGRIGNEIRILNGIKHENIVDIVQYWVDQETGNTNIILEYLEYTLEDIKSTIKSSTLPLEYHAQFLHEDVIPGVLHALKVLEAESIIHRDIKPGNIGVLDNWVVKLIDFSEATYYSSESPHRLLSLDETEELNPKGTLFYMPPESFESIYDHTSDVYSFGISILEMLTLVSPGDVGPNTDESCFIKKIRLYNKYGTLTKTQILKYEYSNFIDFGNKSQDMLGTDEAKIDAVYKTMGKYAGFFKSFVSDCIGRPSMRLTANELLQKYYK